MFAARAHGVITVNSTITDTGDSVRAQAVITNPTGIDGERGGTITAVAIKEIHAAVFVIDNDFGGRDVGNALSVNKRQWSAQGAYGLGLPFGYTDPPATDPLGPWFGLSWPYRDQYDYFPDFGDPLADDVGTAFTIQPNIYGFLDVDGIARGGPTDPSPAGGDPNLLLRGLTGNGLTGPATYFAFELDPLFGDPGRLVKLQIL
jgi:hypothetical protein